MSMLLKLFSNFARVATFKQGKILISLSVADFGSLPEFLASHFKMHTRSHFTVSEIYHHILALLYLRLNYSTKPEYTGKIDSVLSATGVIPGLQRIFSFFPKNGIFVKLGFISIQFELNKEEALRLERIIDSGEFYDLMLHVARQFNSQRLTPIDPYKPEIFSGVMSNFTLSHFSHHLSEVIPSFNFHCDKPLRHKSFSSNIGDLELYSNTNIEDLNIGLFLSLIFGFSVKYDEIEAMKLNCSSMFIYTVPSSERVFVVHSAWQWYYLTYLPSSNSSSNSADKARIPSETIARKRNFVERKRIPSVKKTLNTPNIVSDQVSNLVQRGNQVLNSINSAVAEFKRDLQMLSLMNGHGVPFQT